MKNFKLKAIVREKRNETEKGKMIPAIVYGPEIKENKKIWVDYNSFEKIFNEVGESTLFDLEIEKEKEGFPVLIYDVQSHPISGKYQHIDFYKIKKGKKIETSVELEFVGEAPAVKEKGGILVKNLDEIEIRCLPKDLIGKIKVDLSSLKEIEDTIRIENLDIPKEIEVIIDKKTSVASISAPRSQEEIDKLNEKVEMDIDKVEGIKEKEAEENKEEKEEK